MNPLIVPYAALLVYPLTPITVAAALWEHYAEHPPKDPAKLIFAVEPLLERLGKTYSEAPLRELEEVLRAIYRLRKAAYSREYVNGVDTITLWLTPEMVKRIRAYQESRRPHA